MDIRVKGLIFCSRIEEAQELSKKFNERGWHTIALSGADSEEVRAEAIERLTMEIQSEEDDYLDYIITVDIFSEGIIKFLNEKTGVLLSAGVDFGKNSDEFLRLNIACPRQLLEKGLKAIKKGVAIYKQI